jgi:hypothetical protein
MCSPVLTFMIDDALIAIGARAACLLSGPTCGFSRRPFFYDASPDGVHGSLGGGKIRQEPPLLFNLLQQSWPIELPKLSSILLTGTV